MSWGLAAAASSHSLLWAAFLASSLILYGLWPRTSILAPYSVVQEKGAGRLYPILVRWSTSAAVGPRTHAA
eukprot:4687548-Alexandrium_andersonii.AAC.1